jgi:hypothetical protein
MSSWQGDRRTLDNAFCGVQLLRVVVIFVIFSGLPSFMQMLYETLYLYFIIPKIQLLFKTFCSQINKV